MKNTSVKDIDLIKGYDEKGRPTSYWHLESLAGSGAIRSTLDDMIALILLLRILRFDCLNCSYIENVFI